MVKRYTADTVTEHPEGAFIGIADYSDLEDRAATLQDRIATLEERLAVTEGQRDRLIADRARWKSAAAQSVALLEQAQKPEL
jgi:hypothetical protein